MGEWSRCGSQQQSARWKMRENMLQQTRAFTHPCAPCCRRLRVFSRFLQRNRGCKHSLHSNTRLSHQVLKESRSTCQAHPPPRSLETPSSLAAVAIALLVRQDSSQVIGDVGVDAPHGNVQRALVRSISSSCGFVTVVHGGEGAVMREVIAISSSPRLSSCGCCKCYW